MVAVLLLPALMASAVASPVTPEPVSPLAQAAAYCEFQVSGIDGTYRVPDNAVWYQPMAPKTAQRLREMGKARMVGRISSDVPKLVKQFAQTQSVARQLGINPIWFDYWSFSPQVWAIAYPKIKACDIMVTGSTEYLAWRDRQVAVMMKNGWIASPSSSAANSGFWSAGYSKANMQLKVEGLGDKANRNGVQMSWQFQQVPAN